MRQFLYMRDPLFLFGCVAYILNRWLVKPHFHSGILHSQFNDFWLIPCALPPILWLHRKLGLRSHDGPPRLAEIFSHVVFWSALFEWLGPKLVTQTTGDFMDVIAYAFGGMVAGLWWNRKRLFPVLKSI